MDTVITPPAWSGLIKKYRLMNVNRVICGSPGACDGVMSLDLRPNIVEITQSSDRGGDRTVIVMMKIPLPSPSRTWMLSKLDVILVGRIEILGPATVQDAIELDGQSWGVSWGGVGGAENLISIQPYLEEAIWLDRSFGWVGGVGADGGCRGGPVEIGPDLDKLYREKRACMASLIVNERLWRTTPKDQVEVRQMHEAVVMSMRSIMTVIDRKIADEEAARA